MKKRNEDNPDFLGELGDMLPSDVLKVMNELLEQLHRKDKNYQGSTVIIYAPGSQYVDKQFNFDKFHPDPPKGREKGTINLPEALATDGAMALWKKAQQAGYVDEHFQPLLSRTQAALLAHYMAKKLEIKDKWKTFEMLWNRRNMYRDYYDAMNQDQTYLFLDKLKELFD
jgi:hypothetical protein